MTGLRAVRFAALIACVCPISVQAQSNSLYTQSDMLDAPAIITSLRGNISFTKEEKKNKDLTPHDIIFPHQSVFTADKESHAFLVFSNGVAIGVDSESVIDIEHYKQLPFTSKKESQQFEPSVSELRIRMTVGSISVVSDHLSPLSKFTIDLPIGHVRIHSASAHIHYDETGVRITAYSGSLTYYYPDEKGREFIAEPSSMRMSRESALLGRHADTITVEEAEEDWNVFTLATENAGKRVFFKAGGKKAAPTPVLIVPQGYFKQPESRPYEFIK
ncbi:MAG: hypothetical protein AAGC73_03610 [Verrucomicrobiota bacterium]